MIISNESMDSNDPKDLDDPQLFDDPSYSMIPQLFDDQLEVWTLIIEKSTVIPPSLMVLFFMTFAIKGGVLSTMKIFFKKYKVKNILNHSLTAKHILHIVC